MSVRKPIPRRQFVKSSMAATGGLFGVKPEHVFSSDANTALSIGLLGCGGRGTAVARAFVQNTNTQVTAMADLFDDRLDAVTGTFKKLQSEKKIKTFKGKNAYRDLLNSDIDIVIISTPPFYHVPHLEAAVEAGKHIYLEKPVAVDVRGCHKVLDLARKVQGKRSVDVGFQMRSGPHFAELTRRIHGGALGDIAMVQGYYFAGDLPRKATPAMSRTEARIRDWWFEKELSGDILVEQNVHIIDVFNWALKAHPIRATATGGRKVRIDIGDVWDHYCVTYEYPNNIQATFTSCQFLPQWGNPGYRFFGKKGYAEAHFQGGLRIVGDEPWEAGAESVPAGTKPEVEPLKDATPEKAKAFVESIHSSKYHNQLYPGTESCLSALLGREAAYEGTELTWQQMLDSDQHFDTVMDLDQL